MAAYGVQPPVGKPAAGGPVPPGGQPRGGHYPGRAGAAVHPAPGAGADGTDPGRGPAVGPERPDPAAGRSRIYPLRPGGGPGTVRPAGRHPGRVLPGHGAAGALRIFRRRDRLPGHIGRRHPAPGGKPPGGAAASGGGGIARLGGACGGGRRRPAGGRSKAPCPEAGHPGPAGPADRRCRPAAPGGHPQRRGPLHGGGVPGKDHRPGLSARGCSDLRGGQRPHSGDPAGLAVAAEGGRVRRNGGGLSGR